MRTIAELARAYRASHDSYERFTVLRRAWGLAGRHGVEAVALALGLNPEKMLVSLKSWLKARRRAERGQKVTPVIPPPSPLDGAGEIAKLAAGSGVIVNSGGKRTKWTNSSGKVKSAADGQAWNAIKGGLN
ncbi:hypothetical protein [Desulfofundulus thermosubterraneus]|uniref:Uncharacterized protein n=1 Tax=Desulfofundulus thermosubterraneus DSM 16057 TaxID=1121432 RepID=A0A1M6L0D4_9FIRM|nr:hypothetical protein [Desulfofundulus thermosubterraneus]SHJ64678.1 hypothetical protein SAMN02745219_03021 [Desulfofundulus thermosubterraneus DSM 16057]